MKARLIFLFVILFSLSAKAQNFWEPLNGPFGGYFQGFISTGNYIITYTENSIIRSSDNAVTWETITPNVSSKGFYKITKTVSGKLFLFSVDSNYTAQIFLSIDEGKTWEYFMDNIDRGNNYITDNYLYGTVGTSNDSWLAIQRRNFTDTNSIFIELSHPLGRGFYVDKNDNIYDFGRNSIRLSSNGGISFDTIRKDINNNYEYSFDINENLCFYSSNNSKSTITFTENHGISWDSVNIDYNISRIYPKNKNEIYFVVYDTVYAGIFLLENFDTKKITKVSAPEENNFKISGILFTNELTFAYKSSGIVYYTNDKYLKKLDILKNSAALENQVVCGDKLALCGSETFVFHNLYKITSNEVDLVDDEGINQFQEVFISLKDNVWITKIGMAGLSTRFSTDRCNGFKYFDFYDSPTSMAENSKNEMYFLNWYGSRLAKSTDQLEWTTVKDKFFADWVFVNNQDEIVLLKRYSDTVNITKLDPATYNTLFEKSLLLKNRLVDFLISKDDSYYFLTDSLLYRSADEGTSFTVVLDAGPVRKLRDILEMNNMLFIATNNGVITSDDKGATWTDVNSGLNSFDCRSIGKTGDNTLYLGLAGDVVYRSVKYTSVEENIVQDQIVCTPNPVTDFIEISVGANGRSPLQSDVRIYNLFGQIQSAVNTTPALPASGEGVRIDVSGLAPGMYFVRVGDKVGKFIKL